MHVSRQLFLAAGLAGAMFLSGGAPVSAADAGIPAAAPAAEKVSVMPEIVAKVNAATISAVELKRAGKVIMAGKRGMTLTPEQQKEMEQSALQQLISAELLYQAGQKIEIPDLEKQVEAKYTQGRSRFGKEEDYTKALKELELDDKGVRDYTRRDLVISTFIEKTILPRITVSEEDAKKFYDQNPDKFTRPESVKASHILIGVDAKATADEKKVAREKAEKLLKEVKGGADFAAVAKGNSTCPSSQQGGDLGFFGKGQMVPPFEQAAFALKPGEISNVVETQFGYHIIKLTEKKTADKVDFKEAQPRIEEYLKNQKVGIAVNDFLTETRKTAKIEVLLK